MVMIGKSKLLILKASIQVGTKMNRDYFIYVVIITGHLDLIKDIPEEDV